MLLTFELMTFVLIARSLMHWTGRRSFVGPLAFLLMKPLEALLLMFAPLIGPVQPWTFAGQSVVTAAPGIVLLGVVGALAIHYLPPAHGTPAH